MALRILFLSFLAMLLPVSVSAETGKISKVFSCSFLHWDGVPEESYFFFADEHYQPVTFMRGSRAGTISLKRVTDFEIYQEKVNGGDGEPQYQLLAKAPVSVHINKAVFLVVAPADKETGKYHVVTLDDSIEVFPGAASLFVNLLGEPIKVNFAGVVKDIKPYESCVMHSGIGPKGGFVPIIVTSSTGDRIYENRLFSQLTARKTVIIGPSNKGGSSALVKFVNQLLPQKPELFE